VESNPGPAASQIIIGTLNARTAVGHTADLHDLIPSESLDILAVCETRVRPDAPPAISKDLAPPGYAVINVPRSNGRGVGGLAVIHRDHFGVSSIPLAVTLSP